MVTSSVESVQVPLWIVHRNTLAPYPKLLTPELGLLGVVIVPLPLTKLHVALPAVAVFPASVAVLVSQKLWLGPALAVVGVSDRVIATASAASVQVPLWIVHRNTLAPYPKLLTPELGLLGVVIVPLPLTKLHVPLPAVAVFPASVAVLVSQKLWLGPALAVVGV